MSQTPANLLSWIRKSDNLQFSLERALSYAQDRSHSEVTLEHLLVTLTDDPIAAAFLEACGVDVMLIRSDALNYIDKQLKPVPGSRPPAPEASDGLRKVMTHAAAAAEQSGRPLIDGAIVLAALIGDGESHAARILTSHGLTFEVAIDRLRPPPAQPAGDRSTNPPPEFRPPQSQLPSSHGAATAGALPSPTRIGRADVSSAPAAPHSHGAPEPAASGSGNDRSEMRPSAGQEADKTARRTVPTIDEIQSSVSNLIAENRKNSAYAKSETKVAPRGAAVPPPQEPDPGSRQDSKPVIPLHSQGATPEIAPSGEQNRENRNSSSGNLQAEPGNASPPRRPGVTQWPFAWQETPQPVSDVPLSPAIQRPGPNARPPAETSAVRFDFLAPAQDNWETGRPVARTPVIATTPGRQPFPSEAAAIPAWTSLLPAEERKPGDNANKTNRNRAAADRSRLKDNIPRNMRVRAPTSVEVAVGRINFAEITDSEEDSWRMERRQAFITEAMTVQLKAPDGGFLIENKSPETQWMDHHLGLIPEDLTSWQWTVTPNRTGRFRLQVIVSARTINEHGAVAESSLPEHIVKVRVRSNCVRVLGQFMGLAAAAAAGGALARYSERIWELGRNLLDIIQ